MTDFIKNKRHIGIELSGVPLNNKLILIISFLQQVCRPC